MDSQRSQRTCRTRIRIFERRAQRGHSAGPRTRISQCTSGSRRPSAERHSHVPVVTGRANRSAAGSHKLGARGGLHWGGPAGRWSLLRKLRLLATGQAPNLRFVIAAPDIGDCCRPRCPPRVRLPMDGGRVGRRTPFAGTGRGPSSLRFKGAVSRFYPPAWPPHQSR